MEPSNNSSWFLESDDFDILDSVDDQLFLDPCGLMDLIDENFADILGEDFQNTSLPGMLSFVSPMINDAATTFSTVEPPTLQQNVSPVVVGASSNATPIILNFGDQSESPEIKCQQTNSSCSLNPEELEAAIRHGHAEDSSRINPQQVKKRIRPQSQVYEHVLSERKRRKLLTERFSILSKMVPGLDKVDKTSVLGEAIKYLENLQNRVGMLEEKLSNEIVECAVIVRKSQIMIEDEGSSDENSCCSFLSEKQHQPLPEIEAKVCNNQAILKIHCEKQKGIIMKILNHVEKLNLTVIHINATPFGNLVLDITITVEMDKESRLMANEIVQALHSSLRNPA